MSIHRPTPEELQAELDALLSHASTELQMLLGRIAGDSREFTGGDESLKKGRVVDTLRSYGARADRILSDQNRAEALAYGKAMYSRQQAARLGGAA